LYGVRVPGRPRQSLGIVTSLRPNDAKFRQQFPDFPRLFHATVLALLNGGTVSVTSDHRATTHAAAASRS